MEQIDYMEFLILLIHLTRKISPMLPILHYYHRCNLMLKQFQQMLIGTHMLVKKKN